MDLFWDTETTGLPPKNCSDPTDRRMPHITQLAMKLREPSSRKIINQAAFYVLPDGDWEFAPGLEERFGVTKRQIELQGIPIRKAVGIFRLFHSMASRSIAYNEPFDWLMIQTAAWRANVGLETFKKDVVRHDPCILATEHCQIAPTPAMIRAGFGGPKRASLQEAYTILVKPTGFSGAHDALVDVDALIAVHDRLQSLPVHPK